MYSHSMGIELIQCFIQIEILLFASLDEDQTVQRIQPDPDLHFLLTETVTVIRCEACSVRLMSVFTDNS